MAVWPLLWSGMVMAAGGGIQGHAYVSNFDSDTVSVFEITADGSLRLASTVPVPTGAGQPLAGAMPPDGRHLYYANFGSADVSAFRIADGGALSLLGVFAPRAAVELSNASGVAITPDGRRLIVSFFNGGGAGSLAVFDIAADGGLLPNGDAVSSMGEGTAGVAIAPDGRFLYCANKGTSTVSIFEIGVDGRLRSISPPSPTDAGALVLTLSPDGRYLYVANADSDSVTAFAVASDGALRQIGDHILTGGASPRGVLVTPDGAHLYVAHYNTGHNGSLPGSVAAFAIAADGSLTPTGPVLPSDGGGAEALALAPDGRTLYVANFGTSTITLFDRDAFGELLQRGTPLASGGEHPDFQSIVIRPI